MVFVASTDGLRMPGPTKQKNSKTSPGGVVVSLILSATDTILLRVHHRNQAGKTAEILGVDFDRVDAFYWPSQVWSL